MKALFCTDGSTSSLYAIEKAMPFLKQDCMIDILSVVELIFFAASNAREFETNISLLNELTQEIIENNKNYIESKGFQVGEKIIKSGDPGEIILNHLYKNSYDLIILGSHGQKGLNRWLGSVSRKIANKSPYPFLLATPPEKPEVIHETPKILITVDGSECSYFAAKKTITTLNLKNCEIEIIYVKEGIKQLPSEITHDKEWLSKILTKEEEIAEKIVKVTEEIFKEQKIKINSKIILEGNPADEILKYIKNQKKDLIILGSHGKEGFATLLLGSVSKRILEHAYTPTIIFPTKRKIK